jgi:tripartite-type tricarboxylate transporter receptor subunit TctC
MRVLASWGEKRLESLPDVPTFKELGYDIQFYIWSGLFAPQGVPEPMMKTLREAAAKAVEDADFKAQMASLETPIAYLDAPEFQKFWDKDAQMLAEAVRNVGKVEEK